MRLNPITSETTRLLLRTFESKDLNTFIAYRNDPEVAKYQSWDVPYPETAAREFIEYMQQGKPGTLGEWYQLAITLKTTDEIIGDCAYGDFKAYLSVRERFGEAFIYTLKTFKTSSKVSLNLRYLSW